MEKKKSYQFCKMSKIKKRQNKNRTDEAVGIVQRIYNNKMQLVMNSFKEKKNKKRHSSNKCQTNNKMRTKI